MNFFKSAAESAGKQHWVVGHQQLLWSLTCRSMIRIPLNYLKSSLQRRGPAPAIANVPKLHVGFPHAHTENIPDGQRQNSASSWSSCASLLLSFIVVGATGSKRRNLPVVPPPPDLTRHLIGWGDWLQMEGGGRKYLQGTPMLIVSNLSKWNK